MIKREVDILIIGGGLIGATLMLALRGLGYSCLLVEHLSFDEKNKPDFDARSLALAPASANILSMLGVWDELKDNATPIRHIHVSQQHHFGSSHLHAKPDEALGYVLELYYLNSIFHQRLDKDCLLAPATLVDLQAQEQQAHCRTATEDYLIKAQLIVAADGAHSVVRQLSKLPAKVKEFNQQALVANIGLAKSHGYQAFERFTPNGPLALLPLQDKKMSLVWAMKAEQACELLAVSDAVFLKHLQKAFGYKLGRFSQVGTRTGFTLKQIVMPLPIQWPLVFIGNAAHSLHPVAGQGFNLGLRDVAALAQCIAQHGLNAEMLARYWQLRKSDQTNIVGFTNGLINLFTSRIPGIALARTLGLIALDNSQTLKKQFARLAQGYSGVIPDLVCQIPIK